MRRVRPSLPPRLAPAPPFAGLLGLLALVAPGCAGDGDAGERRSAVLVTLDTTRADALSCYGGPPGLTPRLDALAEEGVRYAAARTVAPLTLPAHASMLTGLYPPQHRVRLNSNLALPDEATTVAELARAAGFQTAAFVAAVVLSREFGLDQGFDVYGQPASRGDRQARHYDERPAAEVVAEACAWLRARDPGRPFFLWVHLFDPHAPYEPPPDARARAAGSAHPAYHGEVAAMDDALGGLFDALRGEGVWEELVVVVAGDHGEALGEHGEPSHGGCAWDSTLRVPLLVRDPGDDPRRQGRRSDALVSVVDVFPTLVETLGLRPPASAGSAGRSLFRREPPSSRGVYFETFFGWSMQGWSPLAGWVDGRGKYVHASRPELYDVAADPAERRDLLAEGLDGGVDVARYRDAIRAVISAPGLERSTVDSEALMARLRALGYLGAGELGDDLPDPLAPSERPSPHDRVDAWVRYLRAQTLLAEGRYEEGATILRQIARENPHNAAALLALGGALLQAGRPEEALAPLGRALQASGSASVHWSLALCHDRLGDAPAAREHYARALALEPRRADELAQALERIADAEPERAELYRSVLAESRGATRE